MNCTLTFQLHSAQIIQGQVTPVVGQSSASSSAAPVALVKSVSAAPAVTVPVNVGQQRTVLGMLHQCTFKFLFIDYSYFKRGHNLTNKLLMVRFIFQLLELLQ